jgi:ABC-type phosphate transport system substrate-binding protein
MKNRLGIASTLCVLAIFLVFTFGGKPVSADDQIAIIVNPANTVSGLALADLHKIFMGEKSTWPNGKHILLVVGAPGTPERASFMRGVYKMSETDYTKYFLQASFTGMVSSPPKEASSSSQVKEIVAENPGAVGFVKKSEVDGSVKVVFTLP